MLTLAEADVVARLRMSWPALTAARSLARSPASCQCWSMATSVGDPAALHGGALCAVRDDVCLARVAGCG